jgi:hypothetical protein
MSEDAGKCLQPDLLLSTPKNCTWEQIRQCHGPVPGHPCLAASREARQETSERGQE